MNKRLISLGMSLMLLVVFSACSQEQAPQQRGAVAATTGQYDDEKDFKVKIIDNGKAVEIVGYEGTKKEVRIPPTIQNLPVTVIGDNAFREKNLMAVTIPHGVTTIGNRAFQINQLNSVTIPDSVTSIGKSAFQINQLNSATIPNSVTAIGERAFSGNYLTSVAIPDGVVDIAEGTFGWNLLASVIIPKGVTSIGKGAFWRNRLTSVTIPNSVTVIGDSAFQENELTSITIPDSVTVIGDSAFLVNELTSITIGANVTLGTTLPVFDNFDPFYKHNESKGGTYTCKDGHWSIYDAEKDLHVRITGTEEGFLIKIIDDGKAIRIVGYAGTKEAVRIPPRIRNLPVTEIGDYAFRGENLTGFTVPDSVRAIGRGAFMINHLTDITIPNGVTSIGSGAFWENKITSITIGANVKLGIGEKVPAFNHRFDDFYGKNNSKAGTYIYRDGRWNEIRNGE